MRLKTIKSLCDTPFRDLVERRE